MEDALRDALSDVGKDNITKDNYQEQHMEFIYSIN